MDAVTKNRSLVSIIIFLVISNIAILLYFLYFSDGRKGSHGKDRNAVSVFLQKDIGFNKQQMDAYQKLKTSHLQTIKPLFNDIRTAKENFYNLLYVNNVSDSSIDKAAAVIGEKQIALDKQMFNHFTNVRNLCTPQELPKFDSSFKKVVEKMTGGRFRKGTIKKAD